MAAPVWDPTAKRIVFTTSPSETVNLTVTFTGVNVKRVKTDGGPINPSFGRNLSTCPPSQVPPGIPSMITLEPANTYTITPAFLRSNVCPNAIGAAAMQPFDAPHSSLADEADIMHRIYDFDFIDIGLPGEGVHITMEIKDDAGGNGDKHPKKEKEKDLQA
jgi:hypothetical protein